MCLIVFAWQLIPDVPLIAAGNRDEFFDRPSAQAAWWDEYPQMYAGRDLRGGGTWIGVTRDGRFAAITNVRAPTEKRPDAPTRGALVTNYLISHVSPQAYVEEISSRAPLYNGFNLLIGDRSTLIWYSNMAHDDDRNGKPLAPGIYGLSNSMLDTPWPKVVRSKAQFASLLCQGAPEEAYFEMLTDNTRASDCRLPKTGVSLEWERLLSAICIQSPEYGTRASTVVRIDANESVVLHERQIK
jgi:uncharacterized protein with NRDE domain